MSVQQAIAAFLTAFRHLDWEPFLAAFAEEATLFFPFPDHPQRADGKAAIAAIFHPFFARLRQQRPAGPPYLTLEPSDLQITHLGESALVTFHLHDPGVLCRRTLFFIKQNDVWLIRHLHASNVPI